MQNFHNMPGVEVRFVHGTTFDGHKYTFALALELNHKTVAWDIALVNPKDQFRKKVGRDIAGGRAKKMLARGGFTPDQTLTCMRDGEIEIAVGYWVEREFKHLKWI